MRAVRSAPPLLSVALAFPLLLAASPAWPKADSPVPKDRVTVNGIVLEGEISSIDDEELVMETVYGDGELVIAIADVQAIETGVAFHVFHGGNDTDTSGRLVRVTEEEVHVARDGGDVTVVPSAEVFVIQREPDPDADFLERAELALPYWNGSFDLGFNRTQATDDSLGFNTGISLRRERGPSRTRSSLRWRLGKQKKQSEATQTNENNLYGVLRQEYDVAARWFVYGKVDGEYDEVDEISFRTVPTVGGAYKVWDSEDASFSVGAGPAYVYQRYFGGATDDYFAMGFLAQSEWELPFNDVVWTNNAAYTPSVSDWTGDYLIRFESTLEMPLAGAFSLRASVIDTYDNSPAEGTKRNNLSTTVGLSAGF